MFYLLSFSLYSRRHIPSFRHFYLVHLQEEVCILFRAFVELVGMLL